MKAGILTRLRIFFGRATRNDLINMFYDAKMRHNYKEVRDIGNKLVKLRNKRFIVSPTIGGSIKQMKEGFAYENDFLDQYSVSMTPISPMHREIIFHVPCIFKFDYGMNLDNIFLRYYDVKIEYLQYYTKITCITYDR